MLVLGDSKIVIIGVGGFAKEVYNMLMSDLNWVEKSSRFIGFLDDDEKLHGTEFQGYKVLGGIKWLAENKDTKVVIAIGNPSLKRKVVNKLYEIGHEQFLDVIDNTAIIGPDVTLGKGSIVCAGTIITSNIVIGEFVTINLACTVGHDSIIEDYVTVAPGVNISGNCIIKEGVDFGTGATMIQGKTIGEWSIIGAGSVVVKDMPANTTCVGNPSKVIKERAEGWHIYPSVAPIGRQPMREVAVTSDDHEES